MVELTVFRGQTVGELAAIAVPISQGQMRRLSFVAALRVAQQFCF